MIMLMIVTYKDFAQKQCIKIAPYSTHGKAPSICCACLAAFAMGGNCCNLCSFHSLGRGAKPPFPQLTPRSGQALLCAQQVGGLLRASTFVMELRDVREAVWLIFIAIGPSKGHGEVHGGLGAILMLRIGRQTHCQMGSKAKSSTPDS